MVVDGLQRDWHLFSTLAKPDVGERYIKPHLTYAYDSYFIYRGQPLSTNAAFILTRQHSIQISPTSPQSAMDGIIAWGLAQARIE
jgi:hypothetical protein